MVPLTPDAAEHVLSWENDTCRRAVALQHALIRRRPGLWGDHPSRPASAVLLREGDGQWEAFGAGDPEPAVGWLAEREGTIALLAPAAWEPAVRAAVGPIERACIETRFYPGLDLQSDLLRGRPTIATRRLTSGDAAAVVATAPGWALRGWGSFADLVAHGAGFGVPSGAGSIGFSRDASETWGAAGSSTNPCASATDPAHGFADDPVAPRFPPPSRPRGRSQSTPGFAALAWVLEQGRHFDAVGVYVMPRFRRLGLGRAVATALVAHIIGERRRVPLWAHASENAASRALGRSLGFTSVVGETLLRWRRRP